MLSKVGSGDYEIETGLGKNDWPEIKDCAEKICKYGGSVRLSRENDSLLETDSDKRFHILSYVPEKMMKKVLKSYHWSEKLKIRR